MNKAQIEKIVNYIIDQGLKSLKELGENDAIIDYLGIFSKDENEYKNLEVTVQKLGKEVDSERRTGKTFLLNEPIRTHAGPLKTLKVRKPDPTRPQRGAPDFKINNYLKFKKKWLGSKGTFTLMPRKNYEMIEIKGVDVLVYIPDKTLGERMSNNQK